MLLQEQMKQDIFSYNEKTIINFILEKQEQIITQNLVKGEDAVYTMTIKITDKKLVALKSRKNV